MNNPTISFPFINETSEGKIVFSGIMPDGRGTYAVIAWASPVTVTNGQPTWTHQGGLTFEQAADCAENEAPGWYEPKADPVMCRHQRIESSCPICTRLKQPA